MKRFDIVDEEMIAEGQATDAYFERTEEALEHADCNPKVVAEVTADQFNDDEFCVLAGLKDAANLLQPLDVEVDALPEGTLVDSGPVMRIKGQYRDFARYETALLGFLSHASGMATAAKECVRATESYTGEQVASVLSFGSRHVHPSLGAMVERSALIGGVDGFSNVAAGEVLDREASGTMPHALMLSFGKGNNEEAWTAFNEAVADDIPRIVLCDTFTDEVDEVARAVKTLGDDLDGVRLDTTGSRRGSFQHIIKEVRYKLNELDSSDVDIYVSGGLGPEDIRELRDIADGFGVGGQIVNAPTVDFSLDIVERNGEAISKRGKLAGVKEVYRQYSGQGRAEHVVLPEDEETSAHPLMEPLIRDNKVIPSLTIEEARDWAAEDAEDVEFY